MDKLNKFFEYMFNQNGRWAIRRALHNKLSVPLFRLQAVLPNSILPLPSNIVIEPTNRCNINCLMCARRYWDEAINPLGDMNYDFFEKTVFPNIKPFQNVNLQCFGEPLVHKDFFRMLKACKDLGCRTTFTTNGVALERHAEAVVASGVDELTISIDGVESMKKIRKVGIEKIIRAIDAVNQGKKSRNQKEPSIAVNCVLTKDNLSELPQLVEICGIHGVTRVTVMHLVVHDLELVAQSIIPVYLEAEKYFLAAKNIAGKHEITLQLPPEPGSTWKCHQPFNTVVINWNGDVRPCCISTINEKGALLVGNLKNNTLFELWNSKYMHRLRKSLLTETNMFEMCGSCSMRSCNLESHTHLVK